MTSDIGRSGTAAAVERLPPPISRDQQAADSRHLGCLKSAAAAGASAAVGGPDRRNEIIFCEVVLSERKNEATTKNIMLITSEINRTCINMESWLPGGSIRSLSLAGAGTTDIGVDLLDLEQNRNFNLTT